MGTTQAPTLDPIVSIGATAITVPTAGPTVTSAITEPDPTASSQDATVMPVFESQPALPDLVHQGGEVCFS